MKEFLSVLKNTSIFAHLTEDEIQSLLVCLEAKTDSFGKGEYVFRQGEKIDCMAVLVSGGLIICNSDYWGNTSILNHISVGEAFGEAYLAPESEALANDVIAVTESTVVFLNAGRIMTTCSSACVFHQLVVKNMFFAISQKNRKLVQKLSYLSERTTRNKLMSYLSDTAKSKKSNSFEIPFNRQQLADFLSVDRSAMSNELCKMRDEKIIEFEKNKFKLL